MNIFDIFEDDPQPRSQRTPIDPLRKKALIDELVKKQNGRCMYCGRKVARDLFDLDHKNPVSRGGTNRKSNFQLLCRSCNTRKGPLTDQEFRRKYRDAGVPQTQVVPSKSIAQNKFVDAGKGSRKSTASKSNSNKSTGTRRTRVVHAGDIWDGNPICGGSGAVAGIFDEVTCKKCLNS